jgi:D-alanine-D-alanine ligase
MVFNIAEGVQGRSREAHIPALLEFLNIPYTGSDPLTLAVTLDKSMAKRVVMSEGVPTPGFRKVMTMEDLKGVDLRYPLFVKPCYEGSAKALPRFKDFGRPHPGANAMAVDNYGPRFS